MSNHRYGKVQFSKISTPSDKIPWYYSHQELQRQLNAVCKNHTLKKVYVGLTGYLESFRHGQNDYDFSYLGGPIICLFDHTVVEICIHGMGMIQYRRIDREKVKIESTKDFPPSTLFDGFDCFYDLSRQFEWSYEEQSVCAVLVDSTDCYPFSLESYDEEKAEKAIKTHSLPNGIHFQLANGVDFGIYADDVEYYYIRLCKTEGDERDT